MQRIPITILFDVASRSVEVELWSLDENDDIGLMAMTRLGDIIAVYVQRVFITHPLLEQKSVPLSFGKNLSTSSLECGEEGSMTCG